MNIIHYHFAIEPGHAIVENAGIQVSRVLYTKHSVEKRILIQVTAMLDLSCVVFSESHDRIRSMATFTELPFAPVDTGTRVARTESYRLGSLVCESDGFPTCSISHQLYASAVNRRWQHGHAAEQSSPSQWHEANGQSLSTLSRPQKRAPQGRRQYQNWTRGMVGVGAMHWLIEHAYCKLARATGTSGPKPIGSYLCI